MAERSRWVWIREDFVVVAQPTTTGASTTRVPPPSDDVSGCAMCAFIFSIIMLVFCSSSLIGLALSLPAFILSIVAVVNTGSTQKKYVGISIGLNVLNIAIFACTMLFLAIFIPAYVIGVALSAGTDRTELLH